MRLVSKVLSIILCLICVGVLSACDSSTSNMHLTDISSFEDIFEDVYLMEIGQKDHSFTCVYEEDINSFIDILKTLEVKEEPVSEDIYGYLDRTNYIYMRKKDKGYVKLFLDEKNETIWMGRGEEYSYYKMDEEDIISYTYKVANKKILKEVYKPLEGYESEKKYKNKYLDVRVMEVEDNKLIVREERLDKNKYTVEEWKNALKEEYIIPMTVVKNQIDKFRKGDKLRIEYEEIKDGKIEKIKNLYYINELLYLKDYGNKPRFSIKDIDKAMELEIESIFVDIRESSAIWYFNYDDERYKKVLKTEKHFQENPKDFNSTMMIFMDVLESRTMYGEEAERTFSFTEYSFGGWTLLDESELASLLKK